MVKEKEKEEKKEKLVKKIQQAVEIEDEEDLEEVTLEDRVISIEKKLNIILVLVIILLIICFGILISKSSSKSSNTEENSPVQEEYSGDYDVSMFDEISVDDISKESDNKTIVVYMGRAACGYCIQYVPVLAEVQDNLGIKVKYIDMAKIIDYDNQSIIDSSAISKLQNMKTNDAQKNVMDNLGSTPMTLVIKNNRIVDSLVYAADAETLQTVLENNGLGK